MCNSCKPLLHPVLFISLQGALLKVAARTKSVTIRQVLTGSLFLNFQHLHPEFQKFLLLRIQTHNVTKKELQSDVTFFMVMSVSGIHVVYVLLFCVRQILPSVHASLQQILCSTMSVFGGLGVRCLIEHFDNDIEKIVHAFYPLFKKWVQQDYHAIKKLSDLCIIICR